MQEIKKTIEEFVKKIDAETESISFQDDNIYINIKAFGLMEVAEDIQYLLGRIIKKQTEHSFYVFLDINGERKRKEEQLKQAIQIIADQVALFKEIKTLNPMPAKERRIVHLELQKRDDIVTESIGEGKERRVRIKPN